MSFPFWGLQRKNRAFLCKFSCSFLEKLEKWAENSKKRAESEISFRGFSRVGGRRSPWAKRQHSTHAPRHQRLTIIVSTVYERMLSSKQPGLETCILETRTRWRQAVSLGKRLEI